MMHSKTLLLGLLSSVSLSDARKSLGCGQPLSSNLTRGGTGRSNSLEFDTTDGTHRRYLLHIPENYDSNTPRGLVWSYAGRGESAENHERVTQFSEPGRNLNDIAVYPRAYEIEYSQEYGDLETSEGRQKERLVSGYNKGKIEKRQEGGETAMQKAVWQGDPDARSNDVLYTLELLDHILDTFCIDEDRIFAAGMSNGGGFVANILACDTVASNRFAAFAAASGAYYQKDAEVDCDSATVPITCNNNGTRVPLVFIAGGSDDIIRYQGGSRRGSCLPSNPHFVTSWAQRDGLETTNVSTRISHIDGARHYSFGQGPTAGIVQSYYIPKLGHMWAQEANSHFDGTKVFIKFFDRWNLAARRMATQPSNTSTVAVFSTPSSISLNSLTLSSAHSSSTSADHLMSTPSTATQTSHMSTVLRSRVKQVSGVRAPA